MESDISIWDGDFSIWRLQQIFAQWAVMQCAKALLIRHRCGRLSQPGGVRSRRPGKVAAFRSSPAARCAARNQTCRNPGKPSVYGAFVVRSLRGRAFGYGKMLQHGVSGRNENAAKLSAKRARSGSRPAHWESAEKSRSGSRPARCRSIRTNRPRKMVIDGRSQLGRRVADLCEDYAARLGGWTRCRTR